MHPLDFRISINAEIPSKKVLNNNNNYHHHLYILMHTFFLKTEPKPNGDYTYERQKDRLSYQHGGLNFDLTQVKTIKVSIIICIYIYIYIYLLIFVYSYLHVFFNN